MGELKKWELYEGEDKEQRSWKRSRREKRKPPFFFCSRWRRDFVLQRKRERGLVWPGHIYIGVAKISTEETKIERFRQEKLICRSRKKSSNRTRPTREIDKKVLNEKPDRVP